VERLANEVKWDVGDGSMRSFWYSWFLDKPVILYPMILNSSIINDGKLALVISEQGIWRENQLNRLPQYLAAEIREIQPSKVADNLKWTLCSSGTFKVKQACLSWRSNIKFGTHPRLPPKAWITK